MEGCFRQEGYFLYLFGVEEEDYFGAITPGGRSLLFMPRLPPEHAVWMGPIAGTPMVQSWATSAALSSPWKARNAYQNAVLAGCQTHSARRGAEQARRRCGESTRSTPCTMSMRWPRCAGAAPPADRACLSPAPRHVLLTLSYQRPCTCCRQGFTCAANMSQVLKEQEASVLHLLCGVNSDRYRPGMERACMRSCERCGRAYIVMSPCAAGAQWAPHAAREL